MDKIFEILTKLTLHSRLIILLALLCTIIFTLVAVIKALSHTPVSQPKSHPVYGPTIYLDRGEVVNTKHKDEHDKFSPLPKKFRYRQFSHDKLKLWLKNRNSVFAQDEYFYIIVDVAQNYGVNPILLFSILGQEQNFVQTDNAYASEMINNPFNVFGSWQTYNTDLRDSTEIASRTIITIFESFPETESPFQWLNSRDGMGGYAEDPLWGKGVEFFFNKLSEVVDK